MQSRSLGTALLCGCLLAFPALAADKPDASKDADGGKMTPGDYTGKLTTAPGSDGTFTVNVESDHFKPDPKEAQQVARDEQKLAQLQTDLANARNAKEYNQRLQRLNDELARLQALALKPGGKVVKEYKEVDFTAGADVKVRALNLPTKFDDKGNPVEYTKKELKELKGKDTDLPGYESTLDALKVGDTVRVTLVHPKPAKKDADADKTKDADKTDDKDAEAAKPNVVTVIVILAEDDGDNAKKKK